MSEPARAAPVQSRPVRRSPLGAVAPSAARPAPDAPVDDPGPSTADRGTTLVERPFLTHVDLRLDPDDRGALAAVRTALGLRLPLEPNTTASPRPLTSPAVIAANGPPRIEDGAGIQTSHPDLRPPAASVLHAFWLGPDEWLLLAEPGAGGMLVRVLRAALHPRAAAVTDLSAGATVLRLRGPEARAVLAHGCALDLGPAAFPPGACAQTLLARAQVLVAAIDARPTFDLIVRRSFAPYAAAWLRDAGSAHGLRLARPRAA